MVRRILILMIVYMFVGCNSAKEQTHSGMDAGHVLRLTLHKIQKKYYQKRDIFSILQGALDTVVVRSRTDYKAPLIKRNDLDKAIDSVALFFNKLQSSGISPDSLLAWVMPVVVSHLDPHAIWFSPERVKLSLTNVRGFYGIGINFTVLQDTMYIVSPILGGPAYKSGIIARDRIIAIDSESVIGWRELAIQKKLITERPIPVTLTVLRHQKSFQDTVFQIFLIRRKVYAQSVFAAMLDSVTCYVRIGFFSKLTTYELGLAARGMRAKNAKQIILDLRNNSGGSIASALATVDAFVSGGYILEKEVYQGKSEPRYSTNATLFDAPLVVLVDHLSASASEIVAGAIQDLDRGLIIGTRTFGKGLLQVNEPLGRGGALRLTIGEYETPSGRPVQRTYKNLKREEYFMLGGTADTTSGEIFRTLSGRIVRGNQGIGPDLVVKDDTIPKIVLDVISLSKEKHLFTIFADHLIRKYPIFLTSPFILLSDGIPSEEIESFFLRVHVNNPDISLSELRKHYDDFEYYLSLHVAELLDNKFLELIVSLERDKQLVAAMKPETWMIAETLLEKHLEHKP